MTAHQGPPDCERCSRAAANSAAIWAAAPFWACNTTPVSDNAGRDQGHKPHLWQREGITVRCRGYRQPQRPPNYAPPSNPDDPFGERADIAADYHYRNETTPSWDYGRTSA